MLLEDYIPNIDKKIGKIFFSGISFDSSKVKKNDIFFAIKGNKFDGNNYINLAIKKGAKIIISEKKINTFVSVFPTSKPKFVLAVMMDEPKINKDYIYEYRDGSNFKLKGSPRNTAGWNSVEVSGHIVEKIGPILATKYSEVN